MVSFLVISPPLSDWVTLDLASCDFFTLALDVSPLPQKSQCIHRGSLVRGRRSSLVLAPSLSETQFQNPPPPELPCEDSGRTPLQDIAYRLGSLMITNPQNSRPFSFCTAQISNRSPSLSLPSTLAISPPRTGLRGVFINLQLFRGSLLSRGTFALDGRNYHTCPSPCRRRPLRHNRSTFATIQLPSSPLPFFCNAKYTSSEEETDP